MQDFIDLHALRDIGLTHDVLHAALAQPRPDGTRLARVVDIRRDHLVVHDGRDAHAVVPWPTLRVALEIARDTLVVGDWVWWRATASDDERGWLVARLPARNRLTRRDPAGGPQGLVANVDTALVVMGLDGDFNLRRLDRFLVLAQSARARPVVVLTKADLRTDVDAVLARVRAHLGATGAGEDGDTEPGADDPAAAIPVVALDTRAASTADALAPWLVRGRTLVMLGSSGAGKTTLANTVAGYARLTGAVRASDERGQHTTTARTLRRAPGGACLIDTPGLRQLWLDAEPDDLQRAFPEVGRLALQCRFRDCRHATEPGCAVRDHVPPERLDSFRKLLREARRDQLDAFERRRQVALYRQRTREVRQRQAAQR